MLKIDPSDGARIRVTVPMTDEPGDLDMHVYAPNGAPVGSSTKLQEMVPGTTYTGSAKVV